MERRVWWGGGLIGLGRDVDKRLGVDHADVAAPWWKILTAGGTSMRLTAAPLAAEVGCGQRFRQALRLFEPTVALALGQLRRAPGAVAYADVGWAAVVDDETVLVEDLVQRGALVAMIA